MATVLYVVGAIILLACFIMPFAGGAGITGLLSTIFSSGPVALILFGIASIMDRVECIETFIYEIHEVEIDNMNKLLKKSEVKKWRCHGCGRENASYVGTCGCGKKRDEN